MSKSPIQDSDHRAYFHVLLHLQTPIHGLNQLWDHSSFCTFVYKAKISSSSLRETSRSPRSVICLETVAFANLRMICSYLVDFSKLISGKASYLCQAIWPPWPFLAFLFSPKKRWGVGEKAHQSFFFLWNIMYNYVKKIKYPWRKGQCSAQDRKKYKISQNIFIPETRNLSNIINDYGICVKMTQEPTWIGSHWGKLVQFQHQ